MGHRFSPSMIGQRVVVKGFGPGILRFYGPHAYKPGYRCGVQLDEPKGLNNGTVQGYVYFECKDGYGVLVDPRKVRLADPNAAAASSSGGASRASDDLCTVDPAPYLSSGQSMQQAQVSYLSQGYQSAETEFRTIDKKKRGSSFHDAEQNKARNRYVDILPYDDTRIRLSRGEHDYINANLVTLPLRPKEARFVCSQGPLPGTVGDHW